MQGKPSLSDEVARRRSLRTGKESTVPDPESAAGVHDDLPKMSWREVMALTVAAYQVLLPLLLALVGALLIAYLLFAWYFH